MGYLFEEVQGRPFWELFLIPEEVEPVKSVFDRLRAGRFPNEFENYWVTRDGDRRLIVVVLGSPESRIRDAFAAEKFHEHMQVLPAVHDHAIERTASGG